MPDYSKGLIYKLCSKDPEIPEIYVGSTTNFTKRKAQHKSNCKNEKRRHFNLYVYQFIRSHGGFQNWDIIQIEEYNAKNKRDLETRERFYIEILKATLNKLIPAKTDLEKKETAKVYHKKYGPEYTEKRKHRTEQKGNVEPFKAFIDDPIARKFFLQDKLDWCAKNRERIKLRVSEKHVCDCGKTYTLLHKQRHFRTDFHYNFIMNKNKILDSNIVCQDTNQQDENNCVAQDFLTG